MAQTASAASLCCLKTEVELANIAAGLYTSIQRRGRTFGTAMAVEANTGSTLTSVVNIGKAKPETGSPIRATVKYMVPQCDETPDVPVNFDCTTGTHSAGIHAYEDFTFDTFVGEEFTVKQDAFDMSCENSTEELARTLAYHIESMYGKYNRKLTEMLVANMGSPYHDYDPAGTGLPLTSVTPLPLKIYRLSADGASIPQPLGAYDITYQYDSMAALAGEPVVIGGTKAIGAYASARNAYGQSTELGINNNTPDVLRNAYIDRDLPKVVTPAIAPNPVISFLPGSVELVEFWEYDTAEKRIVDGRNVWTPTQSSGTLVRQKIDIGTSVLGRPFVVDMQILHDECDNTLTYKFRKDFGLFFVPQGAFCPGTTWNYNLLWNAECAPYNCADIL